MKGLLFQLLICFVQIHVPHHWAAAHRRGLLFLATSGESPSHPGTARAAFWPPLASAAHWPPGPVSKPEGWQLPGCSARGLVERWSASSKAHEAVQGVRDVDENHSSNRGEHVFL